MLLRDYPRARTAFDAAFRLGRGVADELASFAAAYGVDPKASALLMRELGTPAAVVGRGGDRSRERVRQGRERRGRLPRTR